jgi:prophage antirepressor-like protein
LTVVSQIVTLITVQFWYSYMSSLRLFDHPNFGSLTTFLDESGEKYFKANDVCIALRLSNASQQVSRHVKEKWTRLIDDGVSKSGKALYVSKPGLYALIFRSQTPQADAFQDWVFEEVLPKLDADGGYIMPNATSEQIRALTGKVEYLEQRTRHRTFRSLCKEVSRYNLPPKVTSEESSQAFLKLYWGLLDSGANRSGYATLSQFEKVCPPELKLPWKDK